MRDRAASVQRRIGRAGLAAVATAVLVATACAAPSSGAVVQDAEAPPREVLQRYCFACHNARARTAGLALDTFDMARAGDHPEVWEAVVRKLRTGAMPPAGRPRPDRATYEAVVAWLETALDRAAEARPDPGRPTLHRLNRAEYRNAVRDLLAVEIDAGLLPADNAAYGFDNNADALTLSTALTERYLGAAARIAELALGRPRGTPAPETILIPTDRNQGVRWSDELPFGSRGGGAFRYHFPSDGEYLFEMRPKESGVAGGFLGVTDEPHQLDVAVDGERVWSGIVRRPEGLRGDERNRRILESMRFRAPVSAGPHQVQVYFAARTSAYVEDLFDPDLRRDPYRAASGEPVVSSVTITGPLAETATPGDSPGRRKLLVCTPASAAEEEADACPRTIIATLARRAYRRPVTDADLQVPFALYRDGAARGGFEAGIELAVRGILVSPNFLFRFEEQPASVEPGTPYRISDLELASRLSFFLWSSIPDDDLVELAVAGELHRPEVLRGQVARMLADPRAQALVDNFAGQWLHIRNVPGFRPSPELLFHFDDNLRRAFEQETKLFFASIVRENRSVLDLLDADYTYLNERLARHYGIPGVYGERFRRVTLPADSVRRGLLGQGSILTGTSRANRTSPVIRGKWILENILGTPPPPPPPDVPDLVEERDPRKVLPMREQMALHRANPVCAACHAQMDQLGFALENFDAIGEWRDIYASGLPIDASAEFPDGTTFDGPNELRELLLGYADDFLLTAADRLLTYALGRGLEATDMPAVRRILRDAADDGHRFASPRPGRRREPSVPDEDGAGTGQLTWRAAAAAGPGARRPRPRHGDRDEAQAAHRPSDPPRDSRGRLLLRRQDRVHPQARRRGQALLPVAPAPLRQEPARGHAEGAVRGLRGTVRRARRPRPVGLVRPPSRAAPRLQQRPLHGPGLPAHERHGAESPPSSDVRASDRTTPPGRSASAISSPRCASRPGSASSCWSTSTTSRSSTHWSGRRSPARTGTTCAGCTRPSSSRTRTSSSRCSPGSASSPRSACSRA